MIVRRILATVTASFLCLAVTGCRDSRPDAAAEKSPAQAVKPGAEAPRQSVFAGTASCSGRSCHGGLESSGAKIRLDEYTAWLTHDKHAQAFHVLFDKRSEQIARNLGDNIKAHEDPRCLSCHVTPYASVGNFVDVHATEEKMFGVGCESCHGSAREWLGRHTTEEWKTYKPEQKKALGMIPVGRPADVARACVGCHVGAPAKDGVPARDVNHDLIAAGHPRLNFEMDVFLANMPPHWNEDAKAKREEVHAKIWASGQLATAEAGLELLAHRATVQASPWPEFTEYDCFACHHDLEAKSWRQERVVKNGRRLGALPWGTWNFAMVRSIGDGLKDADMSFRKSLDSLETVMRQPAPNRARVAELSKETLAELKPLQARLENWDAAAPQRWLAAFAQDKRFAGDPSWDAATQLYLAIHALDPSRRPKIQGFEKDLAFPNHYDSPRSFDKRHLEKLLQDLPTK